MRVDTSSTETNAAEHSDLAITESNQKAAQLAAAHKLLKVALAAIAVYMSLFLMGLAENPFGGGIALMAYFGSTIAAVWGTSKAARALNTPLLERILSQPLCVLPLASFFPIAYFLGHSEKDARPSEETQERQALIDAAKLRSRQRARGQATTPPTPASTAVPANSSDLQPLRCTDASTSAQGSEPKPPAEIDHRVRERLSKAIPRIRSVIEKDVPDGTPLRMQVNLPPGIDPSKVSFPVMRATRGIFGVQYMIDEGDRYEGVVDSELDAAGLTLDELHQLALRNLRKMATSGQPGLKLRRLNQGDSNNQAIMLVLDGENEASLILLDELWDKAFLKHIPNGVMAVIPARDVCVFIDMASVTKGGLGDLQDVIMKIHQRKNDAFNAILHRVNGSWAIGGTVNGLPASAA